MEVKEDDKPGTQQQENFDRCSEIWAIDLELRVDLK
jgi:hypothetical protein